LAVGLGVRQTLLDRRALCDGAAEKLAGIWDLHPPDQPEGARQSQIHAAFMRTGKSYAADVYETVTRELTSYAQSWTNMYKQTCEATQVRHEQSPEVLDLRMSCLNERLNGFRALTDVFADATAEVVENAVSATNALSTIDRCADVPILRAVVRPPDDPLTVAKVADLRKRLAETKARFDAGSWKETLKDTPMLVSQARVVNYQPLVAETLALVGLMYTKANDGPSAEKALAEAYRLADASRHDEVRAEVATMLVFVTGYENKDFASAHRWWETATAVRQRLGGHELLQAWLLNNLGCAFVSHHEAEAGVDAMKSALALKQKLLGSEHLDLALSEGNLGYVLGRLGRYEEGLSHTDRAIEIAEKKLGLQHPILASEFSNRGDELNALGRFEEARKSFLQASLVFERELGPAADPLAAVLTGVGLSYLGEAKPSEAIAPLERALIARSNKGTDPVDRAQTTFALARALWDCGRGPIRARRLAAEARAIYAKEGMERELGLVDAWLKSSLS
jgi:eukaryotic-like serine/threonine-protein kinase